MMIFKGFFLHFKRVTRVHQNFVIDLAWKVHQNLLAPWIQMSVVWGQPCLPMPGKMLDNSEQDVSVQAPLMCFVENDHRILVQLAVFQALSQQRPICKVGRLPINPTLSPKTYKSSWWPANPSTSSCLILLQPWKLFMLILNPVLQDVGGNNTSWMELIEDDHQGAVCIELGGSVWNLWGRRFWCAWRCGPQIG